METHETEQVMEMMKLMLAKKTAWGEKIDADSKAWREEIRKETEATRPRTKAMRKETMKANMNACMADIKNDRKETTTCKDAMEANLDKMEPNPGEKKTAVERQETSSEDVTINPLRACRNETMACQERMEARLEEEKPASMELKPEVADKEVPLEDAVVMPVGEPRKRRTGRRQKREQKRTQRKDGCRKNLVAARRAAVAWRKINVFRKILTHGYCGPRKDVTAAGIKGTRRGVAQRKSNFVRKYPTRDIVEQAIPKRRKEENKRCKGPGCENSIRDRGLKQQLRDNKQTQDPTKKDSEGWNPGERAFLRSEGTRKKGMCDIFSEIMEHVV
jgi:hypothetical protein